MVTNPVYDEFIKKLTADLESVLSLLVGVLSIDTVGRIIDDIMSKLIDDEYSKE